MPLNKGLRPTTLADNDTRMTLKAVSDLSDNGFFLCPLPICLPSSPKPRFKLILVFTTKSKRLFVPGVLFTQFWFFYFACWVSGDRSENYSSWSFESWQGFTIVY